MSAKRIKLSTFLHKDLTEEHQSAPFFGPLLTFLPHMYAAHRRPQRWTKSIEVQPTIREQYLHAGFTRFERVDRHFQKATRVEMHIAPPHPAWYLPDESDMWVHFCITFFSGRDQVGLGVEAIYHLETGQIEQVRRPG